ncbi:DNA-binding protein [Pontibacter arcticus]|uniref:DNA-binding protein n=1 Tax=Pontibacter arcticus TaxID=2080288 RepID=A0A364RJL5_9BACT|nr:DNA-binding protein [Pontibacter arcticus]RAU84482.1 DNA-binding protein [Pontibacter arcticus]
MRDLTVSAIDRQNILNNLSAVADIQAYLGIRGMFFQHEYRFTKAQVAEFYEIDYSTIERYLSQHEEELKHNGYEIFKGKRLKEFKTEFGWLLGDGTKAPQLGVFNFRAFLNLGMVLSESEKAKALRSAMLNIVIDGLNKKLGGATKFINQRDEEFLVSIAREPVYRKEFTSALNNYLDMGLYKYSVYTDAIYKAIFNENSSEYKQILQLEDKENPRDTMYAEVLKLIASFEIGIADAMKEKFEELGRKLTPGELNILIKKFSEQRFWIPQLEDARSKMASRDYGLRNIIHDRLKPYLKCLSVEDYQRFLGDKSKGLQDRIDESIEVFKRLKDR